jgi:hypothetical protein
MLLLPLFVIATVIIRRRSDWAWWRCVIGAIVVMLTTWVIIGAGIAAADALGFIDAID